MQVSRIVVKDLEFFRGVCLQFYFFKDPDEEQEDGNRVYSKLLFTRADVLFTIDFSHKEFNQKNDVKVIYKFKEIIESEP